MGCPPREALCLKTLSSISDENGSKVSSTGERGSLMNEIENLFSDRNLLDWTSIDIPLFLQDRKSCFYSGRKKKLQDSGAAEISRKSKVPDPSTESNSVISNTYRSGNRVISAQEIVWSSSIRESLLLTGIGDEEKDSIMASEISELSSSGGRGDELNSVNILHPSSMRESLGSSKSGEEVVLYASRRRSIQNITAIIGKLLFPVVLVIRRYHHPENES
ncbi:hypothetical protein Tco_0887068 [Tanacetum coccineum]